MILKTIRNVKNTIPLQHQLPLKIQIKNLNKNLCILYTHTHFFKLKKS